MLGRKIAGKEQQQESSKKQRMEDDKEIDEVEEVEEVDEAELKKHLVIVKIRNNGTLSVDKADGKFQRDIPLPMFRDASRH
ncbi:hypothetical protein Tco_0098296 [Tanacetum coccineum]|uniref:Uncharacterized protein n=1 Tax=Tanacetum coccineum TaxID=301880 RepID=A0ABQ5IIA4_9ASTR